MVRTILHACATSLLISMKTCLMSGHRIAASHISASDQIYDLLWSLCMSNIKNVPFIGNDTLNGVMV